MSASCFANSLRTESQINFGKRRLLPLNIFIDNGDHLLFAESVFHIRRLLSTTRMAVKDKCTTSAQLDIIA